MTLATRTTTLLALAAALALGTPAAGWAAPSAAFELDAPSPCTAGECAVRVTHQPPAGQRERFEVDWASSGDGDLSPDAATSCTGTALPVPGLPLPALDAAPCTASSPVYRQAGLATVAVRVTAADGTQAVARRTLRVVAEQVAPDPADGIDACAPVAPGEHCGPGNGRHTPGGNGKVSHNGWPHITGVFWSVTEAGRGTHRYTGGAGNDELLGHHGSDTIAGRAGRDVLWGDWDPKRNNTSQRDVLDGGAGNDWIYSSHGRNTIRGGAGDDYVWAYYGRGTIDCGPGAHDTLRVRLGAPFKARNCERIKNFCAFGSKPGGGCYKPGEKPSHRRRLL